VGLIQPSVREASTAREIPAWLRRKAQPRCFFGTLHTAGAARCTSQARHAAHRGRGTLRIAGAARCASQARHVSSSSAA